MIMDLKWCGRSESHFPGLASPEYKPLLTNSIKLERTFVKSVIILSVCPTVHLDEVGVIGNIYVIQGPGNVYGNIVK